MFDLKQHFMPLVENVEISKSDLNQLLDQLGTDISSVSMLDPKVYRTIVTVDRVERPVVIMVFNSSKVVNISASDTCYVDFMFAWRGMKPTEHIVSYYKHKIEEYLNQIADREE